MPRLPYAGCVVIRNEKAERISVRIPGWLNPRQVRFQIGEREAAPFFVGRYAVFTCLKPGDTIALTFAVPEFTYAWITQERAWKSQTTYKMTFRGSTLVDISPRDTSARAYPLYLRDHMKADKAPMKKTVRYVAPKRIVNW